MVVILVTGTPGVGKTQVAKVIAKKYHLTYINLTRFIKKHKLYERYDKKWHTFLVNPKKITPTIRKIIQKNKNCVIDSHLSHYVNKKYADLCIVVTCDISLLKKRLENRKYSPLKIRENLDAEIFEVCLTEAKERKHKIKVIDTNRGLRETSLKNLIKTKKIE